jgi:hypothetical protein
MSRYSSSPSRQRSPIPQKMLAIYELVEDTLNIAVVEKSDGVRPSFDGATARYRFEKVPKRE